MINITPAQLRRAADIQEKIQSLQEEFDQLLGAEVGSKSTPAVEPAAKSGKKQVSEAKLKALAKAREARWAKDKAAKSTQAKPVKGSEKPAQEEPKKKRKMTEAWRNALARAHAARRAKSKAAKEAKGW